LHYIGYQTLLVFFFSDQIRVITKLPNSEQSYKGKVKHKLIFSLQLIFVYCFHIHFGYVSYINFAQNRGVEDVNNHFQKCSMKVTFRKRHLKKNIYLFRLFIEKYMPRRSKLSFLLNIKPPKTSSVKRKQTKHVFAVYK
jgi:hypothetical protein